MYIHTYTYMYTKYYETSIYPINKDCSSPHCQEHAYCITSLTVFLIMINNANCFPFLNNPWIFPTTLAF